MDLFEYGRARMNQRPRPDWKKEIETLYVQWTECTDADRKAFLEDEMVRAYAPFLVFVSYRYKRPELGYTWREAFDAGLTRFAYSLRHFDMEKSPRGARAVSSYLMTMSMNDMTQESQRRALRADINGASLDELLEDPSYGFERHMSVEDDPDTLCLTPVKEVIERAMEDMTAIDEFLTDAYVLRELSFAKVHEEGRARGFRVPKAFWADRFAFHVAPMLQDALIRAGYDGE